MGVAASRTPSFVGAAFANVNSAPTKKAVEISNNGANAAHVESKAGRRKRGRRRARNDQTSSTSVRAPKQRQRAISFNLGATRVIPYKLTDRVAAAASGSNCNGHT